MKFGKKKEAVIDEAGSVEAMPPVYLKGDVIGHVLRVKGKEIAGADHMEIIVRFDFGTGAEKMIRDILVREGLQIGNDHIERGNDNIETDENFVLETGSDDDRKYR